jgi:hypothetical protein
MATWKEVGTTFGEDLVGKGLQVAVKNVDAYVKPVMGLNASDVVNIVLGAGLNVAGVMFVKRSPWDKLLVGAGSFILANTLVDLAMSKLASAGAAASATYVPASPVKVVAPATQAPATESSFVLRK